MSRSRRRTPMCGWTKAASEKQDKQRTSRAARKQVRQVLAGDPSADLPPKMPRRYLSKDGKQRFDPARYPEGMRK